MVTVFSKVLRRRYFTGFEILLYVFLMTFTFRSFYLAALLDDTEDDPLKLDILDKADLLSEFDEELSKKSSANTSNSKT